MAAAAGGQPHREAAAAADPATPQQHTTQLSEYAQRQLHAGIIDMAAGQPGPPVLEAALTALAAGAAHRLSEVADPFFLQYAPEAGYQSFREALAGFLSSETGTAVDPSELLMTAGVSHGLDLVARHLARPGEAVLVESPTYFLAGAIIRQAGLRPVPVPTGLDGIDVDALATLLQQPDTPKPALLYTIPVHNNPTGATLSLEARRALLRLAHQHDFIVVADEVYHLLSFSGAPPPPPPMRAVEAAMLAANELPPQQTQQQQQQPGEGGGGSRQSRVVSLGSFSKILAPGARLGWCEAAEHHLARVRADGCLGSGGCIAPLAAGCVHSCLQLGSLQEVLHGTVRPHLARNCAALCGALQRHLPDGCSFAVPQGGYFVFVELPDTVCAEQLLALAAGSFGVRFTPGRVCEGQAHTLRLSHAFYSPSELQEGARRLGAAITAYMQQQQPQQPGTSR